MTGPTPRNPTAHYHETALADLVAAGFSAEAAQSLMVLDADLFQHVRRVMKGDIPQSLMRELQTDLDTTQFHALGAITRIQQGHGRVALAEVTVGDLAEDMNVDPSRASRIASDLVERGYLMRAASQADGRRSILVLTDKAQDLFRAFHAAKWQRTMRMYQGWSAEEIVTFARLFGKYREGMERQYPDRG
jgi:DNA-binding MarR family transcriptional regulator